MKQLIEQIDEYLSIQEKCDAIELSLNSDSDIEDIIEIVRKSKDKNKTLSIFNDNTKEKIKKLSDGGIL